MWKKTSALISDVEETTHRYKTEQCADKKSNQVTIINQTNNLQKNVIHIKMFKKIYTIIKQAQI